MEPVALPFCVVEIWLSACHIYDQHLLLIMILARREVEPICHACDCFIWGEDSGYIHVAQRFEALGQLHIVRCQGTCDHPLAGGLAPHDVQH